MWPRPLRLEDLGRVVTLSETVLSKDRSCMTFLLKGSGLALALGAESRDEGQVRLGDDVGNRPVFQGEMLVVLTGV